MDLVKARLLDFGEHVDEAVATHIGGARPMMDVHALVEQAIVDFACLSSISLNTISFNIHLLQSPSE